MFSDLMTVWVFFTAIPNLQKNLTASSLNVLQSFISSSQVSKNFLTTLYNEIIPLVQFLRWVREFQEVPSAPAVQCILPFQKAR